MSDEIKVGAEQPDLEGEQSTPPVTGAVANVAARTSQAVELASADGDDRALATAFQNLGGSPETLKNAIALRPLANGRARDVLALSMAGLAINAEDIRGVIGKLKARILSGDFSLNEKGYPAEEAMVMEQFVKLCEEYRKITDAAQKTVLVSAKIESLSRAQQSSTRYPGWKPKGHLAFPTKAEMMEAAKITNITGNNVVVQT